MKTKTFGTFFDFFIIFFLYIFLIRNFYLFPFTDLSSTLIFIFILISYFIIPFFLIKKSLGIYLFNLDTPFLRIAIYSFIVFSTGLSPLLYHKIILNNPLVQRSEHIDLSAIEIEKLSPEEQKQWYYLPFFYTSGLFPRQVTGNRVTYFLPYKKGPPQQFPAEAQIRFHTPDIRMTLEGPKTPALLSTKENIKKCFENINTHSQCFSIRKKLLKPHLNSIQSITHSRFFPKVKVSWFKVHHLKIKESERPEGFHIIASDPHWSVEKYVLINEKGAHQTFSMVQRNSDAKDFYSSLLKKTVQSLRVHSELLENKNLINFQLSRVQANKIQKDFFTQDTLDEHLHILTQLIAKITVDPAQFDAYFHLGGHAFLISEYIHNSLTRKPASETPTSLKLFHQEWAPQSHRMIHSALKYAQDIKPLDPRILQLEKLWITNQKNALGR